MKKHLSQSTAISTFRGIPQPPAPRRNVPPLILGRRPKNHDEWLALWMEIQTSAAAIRPQGFPKPSMKAAPGKGRRYEDRQFLRELALKNYRRIQKEGVDPKYLHSKARTMRALRDAAAA